MLKRVKEYEESPEQDEEGNNKAVEDVITPAEAAILTDLKEGQSVQPYKLVALLN